MDERLRFGSRLLDGEPMAEVCRAFGISRQTGYKIFARYQQHGLEAPTDRSRRPVRYANQLPAQIESLIVGLKRDRPHWGARKIRELLVRRLAGEIRVPAKSTVHAVLHRHGLVRIPGRPRHRATGTPLSAGAAPNDLWCADFKGEFKLATGNTATRSPSPITRRASSCSAKPWTPPAKTPPSPPSNSSSASAAYPRRSCPGRSCRSGPPFRRSSPISASALAASSTSSEMPPVCPYAATVPTAS
jgi:transposase